MRLRNLLDLRPATFDSFENADQSFADAIPLGDVACPVLLLHGARRKDARYDLQVAGSCRIPIDVGGQPWASAIIDLSRTGLCMQSKRRFEKGSVVEVMVSVNPDESAITHLARVRWNKSAPDKTWQHGCEFVNALTEEDMETLLETFADKTKMK